MIEPLRSLTHFNPLRSLRGRVGLTTGLTTLFSILLVTLFVTTFSMRQLEQHLKQDLASLAFQMTDKLDRGMFERFRDMQVLASLNTLRAPETPLAHKRMLLETLRDTFPDYAWIGLTDPEGTVLIAIDELLEGVDVSSHPWFMGALTESFVGDVHKALLLESLLGNPGEEPLRFVDVATPVYDLEGVFTGVLGAHLSWEWAREVEASLLEPLQNRVGVEMFVINGEGDVLLAPPGSDLERIPREIISEANQQQRSQAQGITTWPDGERYLASSARSQGYRNYPGLGWLVVVREPVRTALAPVRLLRTQLLTLGIFFGVLMMILGVFLSRSITMPLLKLTKAAQRLQTNKGEFPVQPGPAEITTLSRALSGLVAELQAQNLSLERSNLELVLAYDTTIEGWAKALDLKDAETEGHSRRVTDLTLRLTRAMGLEEGQLVHIRRGALLHDIGKMGVPDAILLKPGKLDPAEWEVMQQHPSYAYDFLKPIAFLKPALDIPYYHHEKWDGTGYPHGLSGNDIPLAARIFAIIDVYDALSSDRPYRKAWEQGRVMSFIKSQASSHFDPMVTEAFLQLLEQVEPQNSSILPAAEVVTSMGFLEASLNELP